jgi:hypothetical protein
MGSPPLSDFQAVLQRTLEGYAQAMAGFTASFPGGSGAAAPEAGGMQASLEEGYRRLFSATAPAPMMRLTGIPPSAAASARAQAAAVRWGELMAAIARDAGSRLTHALQQTGEGAPLVTSLAALQSLWIDCGEAAYGEAARRDEFAVAQAELIMALAELRAPP